MKIAPILTLRWAIIEIYKKSIGNAAVGSIHNKLYKVLGIPPQRALRVTQLWHWKCLCRGH
jgi:hypothetical protein